MTGLELAAGALLLNALTSGGRARTEQVWGYVDGRPTLLELLDVGVTRSGRRAQLRVDAGEAFLAMRRAAAAAAVELLINRAFSTWDEQAALRALYEQGKGAPAAEPGYSDHQEGKAVDLETAGGTNDAFTWLVANAHRWSFRRTVAGEPWHWEYDA